MRAGPLGFFLLGVGVTLSLGSFVGDGPESTPDTCESDEGRACLEREQRRAERRQRRKRVPRLAVKRFRSPRIRSVGRDCDGGLALTVGTRGWAGFAVAHVVGAGGEVREVPLEHGDFDPDGAWDTWFLQSRAGSPGTCESTVAIEVFADGEGSLLADCVVMGEGPVPDRLASCRALSAEALFRPPDRPTSR